MLLWLIYMIRDQLDRESHLQWKTFKQRMMLLVTLTGWKCSLAGHTQGVLGKQFAVLMCQVHFVLNDEILWLMFYTPDFAERIEELQTDLLEPSSIRETLFSSSSMQTTRMNFRDSEPDTLYIHNQIKLFHSTIYCKNSLRIYSRSCINHNYPKAFQ